MESEDIRDGARGHEGLPLERGRARRHNDGAQERDKISDAGSDQPGRMTSIVAILEHDKAKSDAASPRKDTRAEDAREELLPPLPTLKASSQQLV